MGVVLAVVVAVAHVGPEGRYPAQILDVRAGLRQRCAAPFQICHGDADRLVDPNHSVRLHHRLPAADAASELIVLPGFGHSFLNARADGDVDATGRPAGAGRLTAEQPVPAQRDTGHGTRPTRFDFDSIAAFLSDHLGAHEPGLGRRTGAHE